MRKLRVLLVLSALLLVWGTVVTPTMALAFSRPTPSGVVLDCREVAGNSFGVYAISPPGVFGLPTDQTSILALDCATTIGTILSNRCVLNTVIAPNNPSEAAEMMYVFTCLSFAN
jgi:hypothetical protein